MPTDSGQNQQVLAHQDLWHFVPPISVADADSKLQAEIKRRRSDRERERASYSAGERECWVLLLYGGYVFLFVLFFERTRPF